MALTKIDDRGLKTPIDLLDNEKIRLGTGNDLELFHDGSHSVIQETGTGDLEICTNTRIMLQKDRSEVLAKFIPDGAVELYHNNFKSVSTDTNGLIVNGPEGDYGGLFIYADEGDDDADKWFLKALASSSTLQILNKGSGSWETSIECNSDGNVELYYDNSKRLETTSAGIAVTGSIDAGDNCKLLLGDGDDLQIDHSGTNSQIYHNGTGHLYIATLGSGEDLILQAKNELKFSTADSERMRIDTSGRLGVGTTSPQLGVHFYHASDNGILLLESGDANCRLDLKDNGGQASIQAISDALTFNTSSSVTERMRITSSGQLLIGTTSTTGISAGSDDIVIGSIGDSTYRGLTFATTTEAAIRWADAGDNAMGRIEYSNSADTMTFNTANATRMRLDSDGMKFGTDTAAANALDDYEEGSYTPVIYYDSTNNHTYSEQLGLYTKIGNFVYGTIAITWDKQNSTGQVGISLPVTSANVAGTRTTGYCVYQDGLSIPSGQGSTHLIGYGGQNASSMYFYFTGGTNNSELGGSSTQLTDSHTSSNNVMRIVFHYRTA